MRISDWSSDVCSSDLPRTIFRRALELNAAAIILIHNHPSGDARPSEEDIAVTRKLDQIGRALDVEIFDHIVVTSASTHHIANREDRKSTRLNSSHYCAPRMPSSA